MIKFETCMCSRKKGGGKKVTGRHCLFPREWAVRATDWVPLSRDPKQGRTQLAGELLGVTGWLCGLWTLVMRNRYILICFKDRWRQVCSSSCSFHMSPFCVPRPELNKHSGPIHSVSQHSPGSEAVLTREITGLRDVGATWSWGGIWVSWQ